MNNHTVCLMANIGLLRVRYVHQLVNVVSERMTVHSEIYTLHN